MALTVKGIVGTAAVLAAIPLWHVLTYRKALMAGENSLPMKILGRSGCLELTRILAKLSAGSKRVTEQLRLEALESIAKAKQDSDSAEPGGVCFVGSSTFTFWKNMKKDLAPVRCINLAFGGSTTSDVLEHVETVADFEPKIVVYYCGTNDLSRGKSPKDAVNGFVQFAKRIRELLPEVGIVYLSVSLTPLQQYLGNASKVAEANVAASEFIAKDARMSFVDISKDKDFTSNWDWYLNDGLHLNNLGHVKLGEVLRPAILHLESRL